MLGKSEDENTLQNITTGSNTKPVKKDLNAINRRLYYSKMEKSDNFDINMNAYTKMCYEQKKYAFLSDYVRLLVVYQYGGLYFDTDVEVLRSFDDLLDSSAFFGFETNLFLL